MALGDTSGVENDSGSPLDLGGIAGVGATAALGVATGGIGPMIMAGMMFAGFGLKAAGVFGSLGSTNDYVKTENALATQKNALTQANIQDELQIEAQRKQAAELEIHRKELENVRSAQRQGSYAEAAAVNQGANFGSGLAGGKAQIAAYSAWNEQGLSNSRETMENVFALNSNISTNRMALANLGLQEDTTKNQYGASQAKWSGLGSLGGSFMGAAGSAGKLFSGPNPWGI